MRILVLVLLLFSLYLKQGLEPIQLSYDVGENLGGGDAPCSVNMYDHSIRRDSNYHGKKIFVLFDYVLGDGIERIQVINT